jgi:hypothetical protein
MTTDSLKPKLTRAETVTAVRGHVASLLSAGTSGSDISFALAFVATELGLQLSTEPAAVFPVVLHGVVAAACAHEEAATSQAASEPADDQSIADRLPGAVLH